MSTKLLTNIALKFVLTYVVLLIIHPATFAQDTIISNVNDSLILPPDSITLKIDKKRISPNAVDSKVHYSAKDSIRFDIKSQYVYLYGNYSDALLEYEKINLTSANIEIDFKNNLLYAQGITDSTGKEIGKPVFTDDGQSFKSTKVKYNFKTKKGFIRDIHGAEGGGYLGGKKVLKLPDNTTFIKDGYFTTCDHEHPHFRIKFGKAKVIPDKKIITGPFIVELADVPLPIGFILGYFPNKKGKRSGILIPSYGESAIRGFYFENGGYYWGGSEYFDLALKGDIYTKGSWAIKTQSNYNKRYKYSGRLAANYSINVLGEKGSTDYSRNKDFSIQWSHNQSNKARPHSRFSANVNIISNEYSKFNPTNTNQYLSNTFSSSISYSTTIATNYHFSANFLHSQNTIQKTVDLTLPELIFSVNRFYPFRKKSKVGGLKWFDNISVDYKMNARNKVSTYDSLLFQADIFDKLQTGIKHTIPVSSTIKLLKYLNLTNTINYNERWYFKTIEKHWIDGDTVPGYVKTDTINGFKAARDFGFSASLNTQLYGMYQFKKGPVKAIRHRLDPYIGFSYRPDFGEEKWGYYKYYNDSNNVKKQYSIFEGATYGSPPKGKSGNINFSLSNNLEMKVSSKKDTISGTKKIVLIENFTLSTSYNLAADSLNWSTLKMTGRTLLFKNLDVRYSSSWDPYVRDSLGRRINRFEWNENNRLVRLDNSEWNFSLNWSLSSKKKKDNKETENITETDLPPEQQVTPPFGNQNLEEKIDFDVPWDLNISYTMRYSNNYNAGEKKRIEDIVQTLNFSGNVSITSKWKIGIYSGYDFENKKFSYTSINIYRDLHCWEMKFNWIPLGFQKGWNFSINAKSSILKDIKIDKKKDFRDRY